MGSHLAIVTSGEELHGADGELGRDGAERGGGSEEGDEDGGELRDVMEWERMGAGSVESAGVGMFRV